MKTTKTNPARRAALKAWKTRRANVSARRQAALKAWKTRHANGN